MLERRAGTMEKNNYNCLRAVVFVFILLFTSTLGYHLFNFVIVLLLRPSLYRRVTDKLIATWLWLCVALMELLLGIKVVLTGDVIRSKEKSLIIMNHRTRLDWMYFWSAMVRQSGVTNEKIVLKKELKHIPGAGWSMQCGGFVFIKRNWVEDKKVFDNVVDYYSSIGHDTQILIFPEGTNLTKYTKMKSDEFAGNNNQKPYEYLLHPRTTGFSHLAARLKAEHHLDAIYDVTVGYPANFPTNEKEFILGNIPSEVHFHMKRYPVRDVPSSEDALSDWCSKRWAEKELSLKQFYLDGKFMPENILSNQSMPKLTLLFLLTILYWGAVTLISFYLLYIYTIPKLYFLINFIFIVVMEFKGGIDVFQIGYHLRFFSKRRNP